MQKESNGLNGIKLGQSTMPGAICFLFFAFGQDYDTARAQLVDASANNILLTIMADRSVPHVGVRAI